MPHEFGPCRIAEIGFGSGGGVEGGRKVFGRITAEPLNQGAKPFDPSNRLVAIKRSRTLLAQARRRWALR